MLHPEYGMSRVNKSANGLPEFDTPGARPAVRSEMDSLSAFANRMASLARKLEGGPKPARKPWKPKAAHSDDARVRAAFAAACMACQGVDDLSEDEFMEAYSTALQASMEACGVTKEA